MNQNPEQLVIDETDRQLIACRWIIQNKKSFNLAAGIGDAIAIREYQTKVGPADCILFVNQKPVGLIEAKKEENGLKLTMQSKQSTEDFFNYTVIDACHIDLPFMETGQ